VRLTLNPPCVATAGSNPASIVAAVRQTWKNGASASRSTTEIGNGHARPRIDGVRRGGSRRRSRGPCRRNPVEAAVVRHFRGGGGKGLRSRRSHPVRRRDRSL